MMSPVTCFRLWLKNSEVLQLKLNWYLVFGTVYGSKDPYSKQLAFNLFGDDYEQGDTMRWCKRFVKAIESNDFGCRLTGLFAAVLVDLGFTPYEGELLFQIACAPSIAAHAAEKAGGKITDLPFVPDEHYIIEVADQDA